MKRLLTLALALVALAITAGPTFGQAPEYRAGMGVFPKGKQGVTVKFSKPMTSLTYSIVVQPTRTGGYSTTSVCTYFNISDKTLDGFSVQLRKCDIDELVTTDINISLDYIAIAHSK